MLVLNLPFKALMFLTLMRPSLVLFLVLWLKLVKDFLKVRCRLALLPFLISCLIWLDLVASLPLIKERILVIILLLQDRKSGSAGMPRPISYAVFCLKKKTRPSAKGRLAPAGSSLRVESARIAQKPDTQSSVSTDSTPPVTTTSETPRRIFFF